MTDTPTPSIEEVKERLLETACMHWQGQAHSKHCLRNPDGPAAHATITALQSELAEMRIALGYLLSWFPEKPVLSEWRLEAGEHGADDAIARARATLKDRPNTAKVG